MNMNFKRRDRRLNIVHFQKGKVLRNQLAELYQIRVMPEKLWKKGAPYCAVILQKVSVWTFEWI